MNHNYRLAVSDIDGTLAEIGTPIREENLRAIQQIQDLGIEFVLASGRHHENMEPFCKAVPGINWVISAQGGMVANRDRSQILYSSFMDPKLVEQIVDRGKAAGYTILIYTENRVCSPDDNEWVEYYEKIASNIVDRKSSLSELLELNAFKVVWISETDRIASAHAVVPELEHVIQFQTHPHLYEFMPTATSKGHAVKVLADHLGIEMNQVLSMGDGNNDVSMLSRTGASIAMGHGTTAAIEAGTIITPSDIPQTALAHGIEMFLRETQLG